MCGRLILVRGPNLAVIISLAGPIFAAKLGSLAGFLPNLVQLDQFWGGADFGVTVPYVSDNFEYKSLRSDIWLILHLFLLYMIQLRR